MFWKVAAFAAGTLVAGAASAATYSIDITLDDPKRVWTYDVAPFSEMRVTGEIETSQTLGYVDASALDSWTFSFWLGGDTSPHTTISSSDSGTVGASGGFEVSGGNIYTGGFLLGVWNYVNGVQSDRSIRLNAVKDLVVNSREDAGRDRTFETGFAFVQATNCDEINLSQQGSVTCRQSAPQLLIGRLAVQAPAVVPVPAAGFLLLGGLAGLGLMARRKKAA